MLLKNDLKIHQQVRERGNKLDYIETFEWQKAL